MWGERAHCSMFTGRLNLSLTNGDHLDRLDGRDSGIKPGGCRLDAKDQLQAWGSQCSKGRAADGDLRVGDVMFYCYETCS